MQNNIKNIWNYYENKSISFFRSIEISVVLENINLFKKYNKIIDIGSGDGFLTREIFKNSYILGIDNDEAGDASDAIKNKKIDELIIQDATKIWNLKENNFDLIFSNSVLEHIKDVEIIIKIASMQDFPHDFIFTVPNANFEKSFFPLFMQKIPLISKLIMYLSKSRSIKLNHFNDNSKEFWENIFFKYDYKLMNFKTYLTKQDILKWNISAILFRFFKINILKLNDVKIHSSDNEIHCCSYFHFRKLK